MKFHLVTTGGGAGKTDWEVHRYNCADVTRAVRRHAVNAVSMVEATDPVALIKHELDIELRDMGYSEADFRVMPCCNGLHNA